MGVELFEKACENLLDNRYSMLGNKIYKQIFSVSMGSDATLFLANRFLFYCENEQIKKLKKKDVGKQGDLLMCSGSLISYCCQ